MADGKYDDEIWDEHQWEAYLDEIERKSKQLRKFIASDSDESHPRWMTILRENPNVNEAVDAWIEEELQIEDAYFPEEDDEWDDEDFEDQLWEDIDDELSFDDEDPFDEGEEWKELSEEFSTTDNGSIENLQVYVVAHAYSVHILQWAKGVHPKFHSSFFTDFVSKTLTICAKLAGAYSFGFERDYLGANIAGTKKALYAANEALRLLEDQLKETPILSKTKYFQLHGRLFELRNDIGIYVQELREQFNSGFE